METKTVIFKSKTKAGLPLYEVIRKEVETGFSLKHLGFFLSLKEAKEQQ